MTVNLKMTVIIAYALRAIAKQSYIPFVIASLPADEAGYEAILEFSRKNEIASVVPPSQ